MRQSVIERQLSQVHSSGSYFADPLVPTLHSPVRGLLAIHRQGAEHRRRFLAETFRNAQLPITTLLKACQETSLITRQTAHSALCLLILGMGSLGSVDRKHLQEIDLLAIQHTRRMRQIFSADSLANAIQSYNHAGGCSEQSEAWSEEIMTPSGPDPNSTQCKQHQPRQCCADALVSNRAWSTCIAAAQVGIADFEDIIVITTSGRLLLATMQQVGRIIRC